MGREFFPVLQEEKLNESNGHYVIYMLPTGDMSYLTYCTLRLLLHWPVYYHIQYVHDPDG